MPNFRTIETNAMVKQRIDEVKRKYEELEHLIKTETLTRELSLAITNLEQSCMWAVKNIVLQETPKDPVQSNK